MRKTMLPLIVLGLVSLFPVAAMADRHGGGYRGGAYRGGGYSHGYSRGEYYGGRDGYRSRSGFDFSLGLGFIFGGPRYYDDAPRYYAPARYEYDDAPVVYRAPVVIEAPPVVYAPAPVYVAPPVVYRSYDSGYCYPRSYTYTETRYYYGR